MDPSSSSTGLRTSIRVSRAGDKDKEDKFKSPSHGSTRYKQKFQVMRRKFDHAKAINEESLRQLEVANSKIKKLQAENNLLLDAMSIVAEKEPIYNYLPKDFADVPAIVPPNPPTPVNNIPEPPKVETARRSSRRLSNANAARNMNGSRNGYTSGRQRSIESHRDNHEDSAMDYTPRSANGRVS